MKTIILALALTTTPAIAIAADLPYVEELPVSFDERWDGFYGGVQVGYSSTTYTEPSIPDVDVDGLTLGVFGGYNAVVDRILFGVELNAGIADDETRISSRTKGRSIWNAGGAVRLGYTMDAILPYLRAGVSFSKVEATRIATGETDSAVHTNFDIGAGVEAMIADDLSLRVEGIYRLSSTENYTLAGFTSSGKYSGFLGRVGVAYHF